MMGDETTKSLKKFSIAAVIFLFMFFIFTHKSKPTIQPPPRPIVIIQQPKWVKMTETITQTGNIVAVNAVNLVARVEGYLNAIEFTDGTFVKKGKLLFVIEPLPYLEKLIAAQAKVAAIEAATAYAKIEHERQKKMYRENATSLNNVQKWYTRYEETKAKVDETKADASIAAINYSYTHVPAPFDGRMGRHLVDVGNLVGNGKATNLATIQQIDPIYVYFNLNELDLIKLRNVKKKHVVNSTELTSIPVYVGLQSDDTFPIEGKLDFVNTGLNASTGTIEFRALLPNKNHILLPGFFVNVKIPVSDPISQLTIPDAAVQYDQIGPYVLTVDKKNDVIVQRVVLGGIENGIRAIKKGLDENANVVVNGLQNAVPGTQVEPRKSSD